MSSIAKYLVKVIIDLLFGKFRGGLDTFEITCYVNKSPTTQNDTNEYLCNNLYINIPRSQIKSSKENQHKTTTKIKTRAREREEKSTLL